MTLIWHQTGTARRSRRGRFTIPTRDPQLGTWATDQISQSYERLEDVFHRELARVRKAVQARSRVDTGMMRSMAEAFLSVSSSQLTLEFGWWYGQPLWAIFQEFGTRNGITPMMAVHHTFHESVANIKGAL